MTQNRGKTEGVTIIGLTGGVGCGKSTVARLMEEHFSCRVFMADEAGRRCMESGTECFRQIVDCFGTDILTADGIIDRKKLSERVFADPGALSRLNGLVHPCVRKMADARIEAARTDASCRYLAVESAILFEAGYEAVCDEVWYVHASLEERKRRLREGRGYSEQKIEAVMKNQLTEEEFRKKCEKVIDNTGSIENIMKQLEVLLVQPEDL